MEGGTAAARLCLVARRRHHLLRQLAVLRFLAGFRFQHPAPRYGRSFGSGYLPNWAWSWPMNRRVMYNRASCDVSGKPWDSTRKQIWWNEAAGKWVGNDVPDFKADSNPKDHMGPFIMNPEGVGRLFVPLSAMADGPFPEHYEPIESPVENPLHPKQSNNPVVKKYKTPA